jgi:hypothetical protein
MIVFYVSDTFDMFLRDDQDMNGSHGIYIAKSKDAFILENLVGRDFSRSYSAEKAVLRHSDTSFTANYLLFN